MDLRYFACEHIGFSRTRLAAKIKKKLQPALDELGADQQAAEKRRRDHQQEADEKAMKQAVAAYRKQLTPEELREHEAEALAQADAATRQNYESMTYPECKRMLRDGMTDEHIRRLLQRQPVEA